MFPRKYVFGKMVELDSHSQMGYITQLIEPRSEETGLRGFRPGPTQTGLYSHTRWLEVLNFGCKKKRDCTIRIAKTKALISCAVTAQLICVFVFAYANQRTIGPVNAHLIS